MIKNKLNGKIYIGKTIRPIEKRLEELVIKPFSYKYFYVQLCCRSSVFQLHP